MSEPDKGAQGLSQERITKLAEAILLPVRANYQAGPVSRDRVFEALNALAFVTAVVLSGTASSEAEEFFLKALHQNLLQENRYRKNG